MAKSVAEQLADQVFTRLAAVHSGVSTDFGRRALEHNKGSPLVIAVPLGASTIREPDRIGDQGFSNAGRILYVREFALEWYCHAVRAGGDSLDFSAAELLYLDVLRAVRFVCHASVEFSDERWIDQQVDSDSLQRLGSAIVFTSLLKLPIYDYTATRTLLTATPKIATAVLLPSDGSGDTVNINEG